MGNELVRERGEGFQENRIIRLWEPSLSKWVQVGRFAWVKHRVDPPKFVYNFNFGHRDHLWCTDSLGVAPIVAMAAWERGVQEVHYYYKQADITYTMPILRVILEGEYFRPPGRPATYLHLRFPEWGQIKGKPGKYDWPGIALKLPWLGREKWEVWRDAFIKRQEEAVA